MKLVKRKKFIYFVRLFYSVLICSSVLFLLSGCSNKKANNSSNYNTSYLSNKKELDTYEEVFLCDYSTKLIGSDKDRNNNIKIACAEINGTVVNSGDTFSFWKIVGKTTVQKGYKEADAFDANGETIQALGGGVCQISSTIYNAVLKEKNLKVIERHPHSNYVAYVPVGKDAAVNYGTADFKFKNNSDFPIRIYMSSNGKKVSVKIYELK